MKRFILSLLCLVGCYASVMADEVQTSYNVNVTAYEGGSAVMDAIGEANLANVQELTVSGTINGYDVAIIRSKMANLKNIDMTNVSIVSSDYEYYSGCKTKDNVFPANMFYNNSKLQHVKLPRDITEIGDNAFWYCYKLTEIAFPANLQEIGSFAFCGCRFTELLFPPSIKRIDIYAFSGCSSLTTVKLPPSLESVGGYAFNSCDYITKVYVYTIEPVSLPSDAFSTQAFSNATLYVPATSYYSYFWDTGWNQFTHVEITDEENYVFDNFYLNGDYETNDELGVLNGTPDADMHDASGLTVLNTEDQQKLDDVDFAQDGEGSGASIIANDNPEDEGVETVHTGNIDVQNLNARITVKAGRWYFFAFPYDVNVSECDYAGSYVWYKYNGLQRAAMGSGWEKVDNATGTLSARTGYIFQGDTNGTLTITFHRPTFGGDRGVELTDYDANSDADAHWNFKGNPYHCYYDFDHNDYDAPITRWNAKTQSYEAYRPGDDDIHLSPYEAFFLQKPADCDGITFRADHRETYLQSEATKAKRIRRRQEQGIEVARRLINLTIGQDEDNIMDRTRVVLNNEKSKAYELGTDAAKFISTDAQAQLYSIEGTSERYAINERPFAGDIRLGYIAKTAGTYSIGTTRMDQEMVLYDRVMNVTVDLSVGTYDFHSEAGTFNDRFLLRAKSDETGVNQLTTRTGVAIGTQEGGIAIGGAEGKTVNVYTTGGAQAAQHSGNGFIALQHGVYVVSVNGESAKVVVK